jgi:ligand-binding sensor protein
MKKTAQHLIAEALAAITSLAVCVLEVEGREVTLLVSFVVAMALIGRILRF